MDGIVFTIVAFIIALALLVTVHEYGHFWVARRLGVKVLRFSIGFGKPLLKWRGKQGTEYVIAVFPLGGYVKMLDEQDEEVPESERAFAFNRQSLPIKIAVVCAGPLFNILFAIFVFWMMYIIGITSTIPLLGNITPDSIAANAGLKPHQEIVSIADHKTPTWRKVSLMLLRHVGDKGPLTMTMREPRTDKINPYQLDISQWRINERYPNPLGSLGIEPLIPNIPPVIGKVLPQLPAAKAGLHAGDRIIKVDNRSIKDWNDFVSYIKVRPQRVHAIVVKRGNMTLQFAVKPQVVTDKRGQSNAFIGVQSLPITWPEHMLRKEQYAFWYAWWPAIKQTGAVMSLSFIMLGKLVVGKISLYSMSGPVGIAIGAGRSASIGLVYYLNFLGLISVSLAILNILPIPILDGGHLLFYLIEAVRRRPLSEKIQVIGTKIGLMFLVVLMLIALYNDIIRVIN